VPPAIAGSTASTSSAATSASAAASVRRYNPSRSEVAGAVVPSVMGPPSRMKRGSGRARRPNLRERSALTRESCSMPSALARESCSMPSVVATVTLRCL
jgi:hypothetical protein